MDEPAWLAERFEEHRTRLRAVAYRMLGSLAEADEAVQDTWVRVTVAWAQARSTTSAARIPLV
jgi:DNA-directed RNA polymerase specialized sigma24 family protein